MKDIKFEHVCFMGVCFTWLLVKLMHILYACGTLSDVWAGARVHMP